MSEKEKIALLLDFLHDYVNGTYIGYEDDDALNFLNPEEMTKTILDPEETDIFGSLFDDL